MYDCFRPVKRVGTFGMNYDRDHIHDGIRQSDVSWHIVGGKLDDLLYELDRNIPCFKGIYDLYLKEKRENDKN